MNAPEVLLLIFKRFSLVLMLLLLLLLSFAASASKLSGHFAQRFYLNVLSNWQTQRT